MERRRLRRLRRTEVDPEEQPILVLEKVDPAEFIEAADDAERVGYECGVCQKLMSIEHKDTRYVGIVLKCPECGGLNLDAA